jgi:anhydro-N-acetylmuramic acid kinase
MRTIIGLMSGTSMDGVDAAVLSTDGESIAGFGPTLFRPYEDRERAVLRRALLDARALDDRAARPGALGEAGRIVTAAHIAAIEALTAENPGLAPDLVGFHGQTVLHAPERRLTVQIGNGPAVAKRFGMPVVYDFRAADVAAGGEGAPFVPAYHRALAMRAGLADVAVVNIGGVANLTRIGGDGRLVAGDTGPGNALIDDFVRTRTGAPLDRDGALAGRGRVDRKVLAELLHNPWFDAAFPKSLDRDAFSLDAVSTLTAEDGAATLAAFTAETIAKGIRLAGGAAKIVVAGGGAHNPVLLRMLRDAAGVPVATAADLGWSVDFLEAQAFAFLAARSLAGLPLSYPETTGVPRPMPGGVHVRP